MIKSNVQLKDARERLNSIHKELNSYRADGNNIGGQFLIFPLEKEETDLFNEIQEYLALRAFPFEVAINTVLNKHMLLDNIGELLAKIRIAAKKSQSELSKELGWEQSNLSRFESENYSSQTISRIVEYASALGVWLHVVPSFEENIDANIEKKTEINLQRNITAFSNSMLDMDVTSLFPTMADRNRLFDDITMKSGIETPSVVGQTADVSNSGSYFTVYSREKEITSV